MWQKRRLRRGDNNRTLLESVSVPCAHPEAGTCRPMGDAIVRALREARECASWKLCEFAYIKMYATYACVRACVFVCVCVREREREREKEKERERERERERQRQRESVCVCVCV